MKVEKGKWYLITKEEYRSVGVPAKCLEVFERKAWFKIKGLFGTKVVRTEVIGKIDDPRLIPRIIKWWKSLETDDEL